MNPDKPAPPERFFAQNLTLRHYLTASSFRRALLAVALLVSAGFMVSSASTEGNPQPSDVPSPALPVETVTLENVREFPEIRKYTGTITARRTSDVGFERAARLIEVLVDEGDAVTAGEPLAQLDTRHLEIRQAELTAQHAEAAAVLDELEAGPREQTIAVVRAELAALAADVELNNRTWQRTQKLFEREATNEQQLDDARYSLDSVIARREAAQQRLDELEEGTRAEQITAQRANVERLSAQLADVAVDIEDSLLRAPFDGRVAVRHVDEGQVVKPGEPVLRIVESSVLEARIGLPPAAASRLERNQQVEVLVNGQSWQATVDDLLPQVDLTTRTRLAVLVLERQAAHSVVPGEIARIEIHESSETDGFWVPTESLSPSTRGLWSVLAVVDGQTQRRHVEILHTATDRTLVRGTLSEGEQIVSTGTQRIVPGQRVTIDTSASR
jgi:multidrug efflux pump subunit AcrA (membrane-fusion protein)